MGHVVLLGDSIFDNERYVPDRPPVIEQVRQRLPAGWTATLRAVDGHVTEDVAQQLAGLPEDVTHLIVSVGGNDALGEGSVLTENAHTVGAALMRMDEVRMRFRETYRSMLGALRAAGRPAAVCTIDDAIPGLGGAERTALAGFNEVILREAFACGLTVIDLRIVCDRAGDFSHISPIEPSAVGGSKIARAIAEAVTAADFDRGRRVYC
jgi:hypothetical protein